MPGRVRSIRPFRFTSLFLAAGGASAEDLADLREAQRSTRCSPRRATRSKRAASACRKGVRCSCPTLNLSGSATRSRTEVDSAMLPAEHDPPPDGGYTLSLNQPIFRMQN